MGNVQGHATRSAGAGLHVFTRDHASVGYRVPKEWAGSPVELRGMGSLAAFKKRSRCVFLWEYGVLVCEMAGCRVWRGTQSNTLIYLLHRFLLPKAI